nr:hypothetical protein 6 [Micrococcaceae bacterium]
MLRVEKQLDNQLTITVGNESAMLLHSILEFVTRFDGYKDEIQGDELGLAKILSDELHYYITNDLSEKLESDINTSTIHINKLYIPRRG